MIARDQGKVVSKELLLRRSTATIEVPCCLDCITGYARVELTIGASCLRSPFWEDSMGFLRQLEKSHSATLVQSKEVLDRDRVVEARAHELNLK